jgi:hypothetical protein
VNDPSQVQSEWIPSGLTPTFVSGSSFIFSGDQTGTFTTGRRLRTLNTAGTLYSTVTSSIFGSSTAIGIASDNAGVDSGLSIVSYGILNPVNQSIPGYLIPRVPNPQSGLGLGSPNIPALYVQGIQGLNLVQSGGGTAWVGINVTSATGTLEIDDSGALAALKVVGLNGSSTAIEIAMVQNIGGVRTYGGFFLVDATSDLMWKKRTNNIDTEVLRITNSTGSVNLNVSSGTFNLNVARTNVFTNSEIGIYSQSGIPVASIGVLGLSLNDLMIASIGPLRFYSGASSIVSGITPIGERLVIDNAGKFNTSTDAPWAYTQQSNAAGSSTATLTNSPHLGNPVFWHKVNINGSTLCYPCFQTS